MAKNKIDFSVPTFSTSLYKLDEQLRFYLGTYIEGEAKENAPVDTGVYRNNINYDGKNTITAGASYSAAVEYGTSAHTIEAKTALALHFLINGKDVFAKRVFHPGTKPNPVMRNAARTVMRRDFNRTFDELFKKIMK